MMHKERGCKYDTLTFKGRLLGVQIVLYTHISKLQYIPYTIYTCRISSCFPTDIHHDTPMLCENFEQRNSTTTSLQKLLHK